VLSVCVLMALSGGLPSEHEVSLLALQQHDNVCDVVWEQVRVRCGMHLCDGQLQLLTGLLGLRMCH
jgi:hypothetical protein